MKKVQLFTASIYAMAMCACAQGQFEDFDLRQENYTRAFIKEFGVYDPGHEWGFTDNRMSRAVDVNGNEWIEPPLVTADEAALVMAYLKQDITKIKTHEAIDFTDYFVTHVGGSHERYTNGDNGTLEGSLMMNHLSILETETGTLEGLNGGSADGWTHCNNFNAASNANYGGNTLMYDSGTWDFSYLNSTDSKYHNKYIIVNGKDIDPSLSEEYWYVCFDFESGYGVSTMFTVVYSYIDQNGYEQSRNIELEMPSSYSRKDPSTWPTDAEFAAALHAHEPNLPADVTISTKWISRYLNGNMYVEANDIYDDWVVRIVGNAVRKDDPDRLPTYPTPENPNAPTYGWRRIMVEDLSIMAQYNIDNISKSDWDFNDLVFDAFIDDNGKAKVKIQALGGTYPIYIGTGTAEGQYTKDLHEYYGVSSGTMINTGVNPDMGTRTITRDLDGFTFDPTDYRSIKVYVNVGNGLEELKADTGSAPSKICVPATVDWSIERQHIMTAHPGFKDWVKDSSQQFWK